MYWNRPRLRRCAARWWINRNMRCIEIWYNGRAFRRRTWINRNMRCIEIATLPKERGRTPAINRNMRCIEMTAGRWSNTSRSRLIETWDVLKFDNAPDINISTIKINRNMRCIEMKTNGKKSWKKPRINRNMRCIEIRTIWSWRNSGHGLIETWDVLK